MNTLDHYTIETGHLRASPRGEVADNVIRQLSPLLRSGDHVMPFPDGYSVQVTIEGTSLAATLRPTGGAPLVTVMVAVDEPGLARILADTGARPPKPLRVPAALVTVHPTAALDQDAVGWLGDFERCLAWAWIERQATK